MGTNGNTLKIGSKFLGRYKVEKLIGAGGMGVVYRAWEEDAERWVAIKVMKRELAERPDYVARFKREMRAVGKIEHPNVVHLFAAGEHRHMLYMVMGWVDGVPLRTLIDPKQPIEPLYVIHYSLQIIEALAVAHSKGITHRDIKPDNILIREGGNVTVLDFGICQVDGVALPAGGLLTDEKMMMGTSRYFSPEQILKKPLDTGVDIYQVGVNMYEMLAGGHPYPAVDEPGISETGILAAHVHHEPVPLAERVPVCPAALEAIVMKCLAKERSDRYRTAKDLLDSLHALLRESLPPDHQLAERYSTVPPDHPLSEKLAADRVQEKRRQAFSSQPSLAKTKVERTTPSGAEPRSAEPSSAAPIEVRRPADRTAPIVIERRLPVTAPLPAFAASMPRSTVPMEQGYVPVDPISGKPVPRTTIPMGTGYVVKSPAASAAVPVGRGRGHTFKMATVPRQEPPPSSTAGVVQASAKKASRAEAGFSYAMAAVAVGVSIGVVISVLTYGVRDKSGAAAPAPAVPAVAPGAAAPTATSIATSAASAGEAPPREAAPPAASASPAAAPAAPSSVPSMTVPQLDGLPPRKHVRL